MIGTESGKKGRVYNFPLTFGEKQFPMMEQKMDGLLRNLHFLCCHLYSIY